MGLRGSRPVGGEYRLPDLAHSPDGLGGAPLQSRPYRIPANGLHVVYSGGASDCVLALEEAQLRRVPILFIFDCARISRVLCRISGRAGARSAISAAPVS